MSAFCFRTRYTMCFIYCGLFLCAVCFGFAAQDVTVYLTDGSQIAGSLMEYRDGILKLRTEYADLKIPVADLARVDFASEEAQVSEEAYDHLLSGKQFLDLGMEDEALSEFRAAMHSSPLYPNPHYEMGVILEKRGQAKEALKSFSRAIKLGLNLPGMAKHFMDVADAYLADDQLADAADTYYLLYQNFPEYQSAEDAVYKAGFLFAEELGNNEKALQALEDAVSAFPESEKLPQAIYEIGRISEEEGLPEAAEIALLRLISEFPMSQWEDEAHFILGKAYLQERRNEDAIQEFTKVMNEASDSRLIMNAERMIDRCVWHTYHVMDGLPSDEVYSLGLDDKYLWVGTSDGLTRYGLETGMFLDEVLLKGEDIRALAADDLHLWVGTRNSGLMRYSKIDNTWLDYADHPKLSRDAISAISIDMDYVWVGTALNGVYRYDKFSGTWTNYTMSYGLSSDKIVSIASTPEGVWCGTWKNGICLFDGLSDRWKRDTGVSREGSVTVTSIASGLDVYTGAVYVWAAWYGESSSGISKYESKSWDAYELKSADVNETVKGLSLEANDEEAWIGLDTYAMLYDYDLYTSVGWIGPKNYPPNISGDVTTCVLIGGNSIWFGTPRGLGRLDRRLLRRVDYIKEQRGQIP